MQYPTLIPLVLNRFPTAVRVVVTTKLLLLLLLLLLLPLRGYRARRRATSQMSFLSYD